jgi:putative aldouronate transport system substrate-binding protein
MKHITKTVISLALTILMALGIMSSAFAVTTPPVVKNLYGKYAKPVIVNIGRDGYPTAQNLPKGDTYENNAYTRWIKKTTNIQVKYSWMVNSTDYDQKVNLVIASGDLPDIMMVQNQSQFNQLVDSDMVADLTTVWNKYATPLTKDIVNSYGKDMAFKTVMFNNKMMGIPSLQPGYQYELMWVRKDWMDKVGAKPPKTMDDVINLAKVFIEKDPGGNGPGKTIGIQLSKDVAVIYNDPVTIDTIFNYYKSFPRLWYKDATGKYTYGTIAPNTKTALAKVAAMYKMGLIDKEFATKTDVASDIAAGKSGIVFGPWWSGYWPLFDSVKNNPKAVWKPYQAPVSTDGKYNTYVQNTATQWIVVRKGYKYPEIAVKLMSMGAESTVNIDAFSIKFPPTIPDSVLHAYDGRNVDWGVWPFHVTFRYNDAIVKNAMTYIDGVDKGKTNLSVGALVTVKSIKEYIAGNHDAAHWSDYACRYETINLMLAKNVTFLNNVYPGITKTMDLKWSNLKKLEDETLLKIIMGVEPISYFDQFVKDWRVQGGDQIIKEVNDAMNRK